MFDYQRVYIVSLETTNRGWIDIIYIKGLDEGSCSFADYLVTSVHLRGSPENVLFPESILKKHIPETRRATDGKSEEVVS